MENTTDLKWKKDRALWISRRNGTDYEISPMRGYDKLAGGDWTEWELRVDGQWVETFQLLRDAKRRANNLLQLTVVES